VTDFKVGTITHYFDKIGVAVVDLTDNLAVGDMVRIGENSITQNVESMQVEHEKINEAKRGDTIGLKVEGKVKKGDEVYRVSPA